MKAQTQCALDPAFLTGSRYFETAQAASDTDWFMRDSQEARALLESCGFVQTQDFPTNVDVRAVYRSRDRATHVLLVVNSGRRGLVQYTIKLAGLGPFLSDRKLAGKIWRMGLLLTEPKLRRAA